MSLYKNDSGIFESTPGVLRAIGAYSSNFFAHSVYKKYNNHPIHQGVIAIFSIQILITLGYLFWMIHDCVKIYLHNRDTLSSYSQEFIQSARVLLLASFSLLTIIFSSRIFPISTVIFYAFGIFGNSFIYYTLAYMEIYVTNTNFILYWNYSWFQIPFHHVHDLFGYSPELRENFRKIDKINEVANAFFIISGIVTTSEFMLLKSQVNKLFIRIAYSAFLAFLIAITIYNLTLSNSQIEAQKAPSPKLTICNFEWNSATNKFDRLIDTVPPYLAKNSYIIPKLGYDAIASEKLALLRKADEEGNLSAAKTLAKEVQELTITIYHNAETQPKSFMDGNTQAHLSGLCSN